MATTVPYHRYAKAPLSLGSKLINLGSDTFKCALLSAYAVGTTLNTAQYQADIITAGVGTEFASGNGYTTGGVALSSVTWQTYIAASWSYAVGVNNPQRVGDIATTGNYLYQCVIAGTTGATPPVAWGTIIGANTTDGTVTWVNIGTAAAILTHADFTWTTTSGGGDLNPVAALIYDSTSGSAATNPLLGYYDLSSAGLVANNGGTLTFAHSPSGLIVIPSS